MKSQAGQFTVVGSAGYKETWTLKESLTPEDVLLHEAKAVANEIRSGKSLFVPASVELTDFFLRQATSTG